MTSLSLSPGLRRATSRSTLRASTSLRRTGADPAWACAWPFKAMAAKRQPLPPPVAAAAGLPCRGPRGTCRRFHRPCRRSRRPRIVQVRGPSGSTPSAPRAVFREWDRLLRRQSAVAFVHRFGQGVRNSGAPSDHCCLFDAEFHRDRIGALETDASTKPDPRFI